MLRRHQLFLTFSLFTFAICILPTFAYGQVVDFGDSGEVVVVEQEDKDSGWAYWFYDEFRDYYPPSWWVSPFPGLIGGPIDDGKTDNCNAAYQQLSELQQERDLLLEMFAQGIDGYVIYRDPGNIEGKWVHKSGSSGWKSGMHNLMTLLAQNDNAMDNVQDWIDENCSCCGN